MKAVNLVKLEIEGLLTRIHAESIPHEAVFAGNGWLSTRGAATLTRVQPAVVQRLADFHWYPVQCGTSVIFRWSGSSPPQRHRW